MEPTLEQLQKIVSLNTIYSKTISNQEFDISISANKFTNEKIKSRGDDEEETIKSNLKQFICQSGSFPFPGMRVGGKLDPDDEDDFGYCYTVASLPYFEIEGLGKLLVIIDIE